MKLEIRRIETDEKKNMFGSSDHTVTIDGVYIPDVYHTVLHVLILAVMVTTVISILHFRKKHPE